jgi:hypothetical protein
MTHDGTRFNISLGSYGLSFFIPRTRWTFPIAFGVGWRLVSVHGFKPNINFFYLHDDRPFCRMWHLRHPYNVVRVG